MAKLTPLLALVFPCTVSAVPSVTSTPLKNDCSSYPAKAPWALYADSTDTAIDGNGDTMGALLNWTVAWGFVGSLPPLRQ